MGFHFHTDIMRRIQAIVAEEEVIDILLTLFLILTILYENALIRTGKPRLLACTINKTFPIRRACHQVWRKELPSGFVIVAAQDALLINNHDIGILARRMNVELALAVVSSNVEEHLERAGYIVLYERIPLRRVGIPCLQCLYTVPVGVHVKTHHLAVCVAGEVEIPVGMNSGTVALAIIGQRCDDRLLREIAVRITIDDINRVGTEIGIIVVGGDNQMFLPTQLLSRSCCSPFLIGAPKKISAFVIGKRVNTEVDGTQTLIVEHRQWQNGLHGALLEIHQLDAVCRL